MKRARTAGTTVAVLIWVGGCTAAADPSMVIADDACSLLQEQVLDAGPDALLAGDLADDLQALEERAREAGLSDPEMEEAMRGRCPEILDELESSFGS